MIHTDVFIVGAGPAGLAAAISARRRGLSVTVADRARPDIDKVCGEGLMPDALASLADLDVTLDAALGVPFRGIRFLGHGHSVAARFAERGGLGIRRTVLHRVLTTAAGQAGATLLWNSPVHEIDTHVVVAGGKQFHAHYIVGADGGASVVRSWARLDARRRDGLRYGFRRHYRVAPWTDHVEVYWGPSCQIYVTPVAADMVCIASLARQPELRLDGALALIPTVAGRLAKAEIVGPERGAVSASRELHRVTRGNVALIGDASGSVDAVTGQGMCLAFRQACALGDAMARGRLDDYQRAHEQIRRMPARMAGLLLLLDQRPSLRSRVLAGLESSPAVFSNLLATHNGARASLAASLVQLSWKLLTA